jgi:hypothetical protein
VTVRAELIEVDAHKLHSRSKPRRGQEGWRWHPSARNHCHSAQRLICFNRDHQLRNAAWDWRAREHHGRRVAIGALCFGHDN